MKTPTFLGKTAISGAGYTTFSKASGRSVLSLAVEACRNAAADAGLDLSEIDGIATYSLFNDSVSTTAVASSLNVGELNWALDMSSGGMAPSFAVLQAAMAVESGMAESVLVFRALNGRSGIRIGSNAFDAPTAQYRYPIGLSGYPQLMALIARRYLIETGSDESDLAAVVVAQREMAALNTRAMKNTPITLDEYFNAPWVAEPFRIPDCTTEVDGGCAVLVTSLERARDLKTTPAVIEAGAWSTGRSAGLDIADMHSFKDFPHICQYEVAQKMWNQTGLTPNDIDVAELYDCFSSKVLLGLEAFGFAERGGAGDLVKSGGTGLQGSIPTNTNGGLLCEGYLHGMNSITEAFEQLQGRSGTRQIEDAERALVSSGAFAEGSAMILKKDVR